VVGKLAEGVEVGGSVKSDAILEGQALPVFDLEGDIAKIRIE
jgi:hypothetical protein